ncbi:MAG: N-formylglutamate amidohydrolase [Rhodobacteraceae bacterium]|nr:N-formylglutamate amidohydrolase [Paracoccaceae bacterium]
MQRVPHILTMPEKQTTACVFASPHSGRDYPWSFIRDSALDEHVIRSSEDAYVDALFASAPAHGAPLLAATVPRAFVDLNRAPEELDPALIEGVRQRSHNPRIASGLGVIPRVVAGARSIRSGKITRIEAERRLDLYYHPYHAELTNLMEATRRDFGRAILFDCHSMPHEALAATAYAFDQRPEIVLGDRFGAACGQEILEAVEAIFRDAGLRVARNLPFAGAHITQTYGRPSAGFHAIQIEIDRALYLDEARIEPGPDFEAFREVLDAVIGKLADLGRRRLRMAAE